jgi:hypothetical protein
VNYTNEQLLAWLKRADEIVRRHQEQNDSEEICKRDDAMFDELRRILSAQSDVEGPVKAGGEDIAARFPYLTPSIPDIATAERRKTVAMNRTENALAAYRAKVGACKHKLYHEIDCVDGYPGGDIATYQCSTCGYKWTGEIPQ